MASGGLRIVGGRDFDAGMAPRQPGQPASRPRGWPLPPFLLAALQNADEKTRKRAEIALAIALDFEMQPAKPL